jgi:integrase
MGNTAGVATMNDSEAVATEPKPNKKFGARKRRGRHEGSVFQRADGQWVGTVSLGYAQNGKRRRKAVYGTSKSEVLKKLRKLQGKADVGRLRDGKDITIAAYLNTWLEHAKSKVAPSTYLRYQLVVEKQIKPHLGSARLARVDAFALEGFYADLEKANISARSRQMAGVVLGTALAHAVHPLRLIDSNPARDVPKPRVPEKEMVTWDADQVKCFLAAAEGERLGALFVLACDSGMRQGELSGLKWSDLDFKSSVVQVRRSLSELRGKFELKEPKTKAGRRRIVLSGFAVAALTEHRAKMFVEGRDVRDGIIFVDERGGFLRKSNLTRGAFARITQRAKLPRIKFHALRHSAATLLLAAGLDVRTLQERLGHEDVETTLGIYAHVLQSGQAEAAKKMQGILGTAANG